MAEKPPRRTGAKPQETREDRLKAALKANLARRKAQARTRAERAGRAADAADKSEG
ncbi:MAG: hypothetical protein KDK29_06115 [Sedimentitalea sp.]|nr:hypothetical protein [Sedimentitalea sp.]